MTDREKVNGGLAALVIFLNDKGDPVSKEQAEICSDALDLLREKPSVREYGSTLHLDMEHATFETLYTGICEALIHDGALEIMPVSSDMLSWKWKIKAVKSR